MIFTIVTPPAITPVTLSEAKSYLGITHTEDDTMIKILISASTAWCEQYCYRKMITQTWKVFYQNWPVEIKLPFGNLQSVTHIKYTDTDGTQSTFSNTLYGVDTNSIPGRVVLNYQQTWPDDELAPLNPIEVQFVTGYGAATTDVPEDIRNAIMLMVGHWYENREPVVVGTIVSNIPLSVSSLLYNHRIWEWCL